MQTLKTIFSFLILAASLASCQDVIELDLPNTTNRIVVEGFISDDNKNPYVNISQTRAYYDSVTTYISNATVIISSSSLEIDTMKEVSTGHYEALNLKGEIGKTYTVQITLPSGKQYTSLPEKINRALPIDSLYAKFNPKNIREEAGYTILYDAVDPVGIGDFYFLKFYENGKLKNEVGDLIFFDDKFFDGGVLKAVEFPSYRLQVGDTATVEQISVTSNYFIYLNKLRQAGFVGGPFDAPPAPIIGNIINPKDPNDYALGYFNAGAVRSKSHIVKKL